MAANGDLDRMEVEAANDEEDGAEGKPAYGKLGRAEVEAASGNVDSVRQGGQQASTWTAWKK